MKNFNEDSIKSGKYKVNTLDDVKFSGKDSLEDK